MSDKPKRIIIPAQKVNGEVVKVDRVSNISGMLDRALGIINEELTKLGLKSRQAGYSLNEKEVKALHGHVKALVELSKEEREREKADKTPEDLKEMSDAELLELANEQLNSVKEAVKK